LRPEILIYDEPTTGLDPLATYNVDEMIISTAERFNVTSIVISHDMASVFRIAQRVSMLRNGVIIKSGLPEDIFHSEDAYVQKFVSTSGVVASGLRANQELGQ